MIRENRFLVLRNKDIEKFLTVEQKVLLADLIQYIEYHREVAENRPSKNYVVIADNWPMYDTVWAMVEAFVDGKPSEIEALRAENESLRKDAARLDWVEHQDFYDLSFSILVNQPIHSASTPRANREGGEDDD